MWNQSFSRSQISASSRGGSIAVDDVVPSVPTTQNGRQPAARSDSESSDQQADGDLLEQEQDLEPDPCPRCQQGQMQLIETVPRPTVPQILELPLMVPM